MNIDFNPLILSEVADVLKWSITETDGVLPLADETL